MFLFGIFFELNSLYPVLVFNPLCQILLDSCFLSLLSDVLRCPGLSPGLSHTCLQVISHLLSLYSSTFFFILTVWIMTMCHLWLCSTCYLVEVGKRLWFGIKCVHYSVCSVYYCRLVQVISISEINSRSSLVLVQEQTSCQSQSQIYLKHISCTKQFKVLYIK